MCVFLCAEGRRMHSHCVNCISIAHTSSAAALFAQIIIIVCVRAMHAFAIRIQCPCPHVHSSRQSSDRVYRFDLFVHHTTALLHCESTERNNQTFRFITIWP